MGFRNAVAARWAASMYAPSAWSYIVTRAKLIAHPALTKVTDGK